MRKRSKILYDIKLNSIDSQETKKLLIELMENVFLYSVETIALTGKEKGTKIFKKQIINDYQEYIRKTLENEFNIIFKK